MKKLLISLTCSLVFLLSLSSYAFALPLEFGPFYGNYINFEMFSDRFDANDNDNWNTEGQEDNWGIIAASRYDKGVGSYESISIGDFPRTWSEGDYEKEISGIFYGIDAVTYDPSSGNLGSIGGHLDIYANPVGSLDTTNLNPSDRIGTDGFAGITNVGGTLLLSMDFVPGVQSDANYDYTLWSDNTTLDGGLPQGVASAYLKITDGLWQPWFEENYFASSPIGPGLNAELFSKNSFGPSDGTLFDLGSEDPLRGNVVPEPTTLLLFGTGLLGLAAFGRKKFMKKS